MGFLIWYVLRRTRETLSLPLFCFDDELVLSAFNRMVLVHTSSKRPWSSFLLLVLFSLAIPTAMWLFIYLSTTDGEVWATPAEFHSLRVSFLSESICGASAMHKVRLNRFA